MLVIELASSSSNKRLSNRQVAASAWSCCHPPAPAGLQDLLAHLHRPRPVVPHALAFWMGRIAASPSDSQRNRPVTSGRRGRIARPVSAPMSLLRVHSSQP